MPKYGARKNKKIEQKNFSGKTPERHAGQALQLGVFFRKNRKEVSQVLLRGGDHRPKGRG